MRPLLFLLALAFLTPASAQNSGPAAPEAGEAPPRPAYMIVLGDIYDRPAFLAGYAAKLGPLYEKYGGHYVAIGSQLEVLEGDLSPESFVVGYWPSLEAARNFWFSEEYQALKDQRINEKWGRFDVLLLEGLPAPLTVSPAASPAQ